MADIFPPKLASIPLAKAGAVEDIVVPEIDNSPLFVMHIAFDPWALVVIEPSVIFNSPPLTNTAALTP